MTHGHHRNRRSPKRHFEQTPNKNSGSPPCTVNNAGSRSTHTCWGTGAGTPFSNASLFILLFPRSEGSLIIALLLKPIKVWPVSPQRSAHSVLICDSSSNSRGSVSLIRVVCQSTKSRCIQSNYPLTGNLKSSALLSLYAPLTCPFDRRLEPRLSSWPHSSQMGLLCLFSVLQRE